MGHPTPSTGRRSADSTAYSPRCNTCGCRPNAAAAACLSGSGRQPYRPRRCPSAAAPSPDWIPVRAMLHMARGLPRLPRVHLAATTVRLYARLLPGRPRGIGRFAETVCRLGYAPIAVETCDMAHRAFAVHLPARRDMIAAWHVGHADCVPGRVSPTDARVAPRRVRLPGLRVSPLMAAALRSTPNCFDAPRTWLWTSGLAPARPSHATMGRHLCAAYCTASSAHHQRRVFSSPCGIRVRGAFSAPSLPKNRMAQQRPLPAAGSLATSPVVTGRDAPLHGGATSIARSASPRLLGRLRVTGNGRFALRIALDETLRLDSTTTTRLLHDSASSTP